MLKSSRHRLSQKKGQAFIEFVASVFVFAIVISASLSYFRYMRHVSIKQEVVRNVMFAKIKNSGTLTTGRSELSRAPSRFMTLNEGGADMVLAPDQNDVIDATVSCVMVSSEAEGPNLGGFFGIETQTFRPRSIAVIARLPSACF